MADMLCIRFNRRRGKDKNKKPNNVAAAVDVPTAGPSPNIEAPVQATPATPADVTVLPNPRAELAMAPTYNDQPGPYTGQTSSHDKIQHTYVPGSVL